MEQLDNLLKTTLGEVEKNSVVRKKRSSLFEDVGNTVGTCSIFSEPSAFGEVTLAERTRLRTGVGCRLAWTPDETADHAARTGVGAEDFSEPSVTVRGQWSRSVKALTLAPLVFRSSGSPDPRGCRLHCRSNG